MGRWRGGRGTPDRYQPWKTRICCLQLVVNKRFFILHRPARFPYIVTRSVGTSVGTGGGQVIKRFTSLSVRSLTSVGYHRDRGAGAARGLYIQVTNSIRGGVSRSWLYRFTSPITRKERWMGLGSCDVIGLAEARGLAKVARRLVTLGRDPITIAARLSRL